MNFQWNNFGGNNNKGNMEQSQA